jgi:hydrogenase 3 maturation protease
MSDFLEGRLDGATRLAVLGVGSELRSDDIAGLLVADRLERSFRGREDVFVCKGCSAPENLTGPILRFKPSHLVIVDCAEIDGLPGAVGLFPVENIGGLTSNTHSLPLSVIFGYLNHGRSFEILVVGIQPSCLDFDGKASKEVMGAVRIVSTALTRAARAMGKR